MNSIYPLYTNVYFICSRTNRSDLQHIHDLPNHDYHIKQSINGAPK